MDGGWRRDGMSICQSIVDRRLHQHNHTLSQST